MGRISYRYLISSSVTINLDENFYVVSFILPLEEQNLEGDGPT